MYVATYHFHCMYVYIIVLLTLLFSCTLRFTNVFPFGCCHECVVGYFYLIFVTIGKLSVL